MLLPTHMHLHLSIVVVDITQGTPHLALVAHHTAIVNKQTLFDKRKPEIETKILGT